DTTTATPSKSDPQTTFCDFGPENNVWYVFTPDANIAITAGTLGSNYDTTLAVFVRSGNTFTEIACNDDAVGPVSHQSRVDVNASAGTTYYFMVGTCCGGGDNGGGNLVFNVSD